METKTSPNIKTRAGVFILGVAFYIRGKRLYVNMYIYMYVFCTSVTYVYIRIHVCTDMHIYTHIDACAHILILHMYVGICVYTDLGFTYMHFCVCAYVCALARPVFEPLIRGLRVSRRLP